MKRKETSVESLRTRDSKMRKYASAIHFRHFFKGSQSWIVWNQREFMCSLSSDFVDVTPSALSTAPKEAVLGAKRETQPDPAPLTRLGLTPESSSIPVSGVSFHSSSQISNSLFVDSTNDEKQEDNSASLVDISQRESLPFDDEEFAEKVLEMEVEGAIDECWQDKRVAFFEDVKEIASILETMKVRDICCVATSKKTSSFDYIMFGTCEGQRHIHLASWAVQESDHAHRISKVKRKKTDETWEVVPVGRILVNLMTEPLRKDLSLERKWAVTTTMDPLQAANAPVSEGRLGKAHGLWTLTLNLQDLEDFEIDYCKDTLLKQL